MLGTNDDKITRHEEHASRDALMAAAWYLALSITIILVFSEVSVAPSVPGDPQSSGVGSASSFGRLSAKVRAAKSY